MSGSRPTIRLDKWLWHARFFKTRTLASQAVAAGRVRVNSARVSKPATGVGIDDTLTFSIGQKVRVIRVLALSQRRGPATEAALLYDDLSPQPAGAEDPGQGAAGTPDQGAGAARSDVPPTPRFEGKGRPSKRDRRVLDLSRRKLLE